jgi:Pyruvate/2-oxoglutarate dehydrogenase complex, dehydrogenase (E1) component, eukaryotic type, alpha subunit
MDRTEIVDKAFRARVAGGDLPDVAPGHDLSLDALRGLFRAQSLSRHLDRMARQLQAQGKAFYTIGSSGHEGMAGVAHALRPTDPAYLHYRDGAFQIARADQVLGQDMARDML